MFCHLVSSVSSASCIADEDRGAGVYVRWENLCPLDVEVIYSPKSRSDFAN